MRGALCVIKLAMSGYVFSTGKDPRQTYFYFESFFKPFFIVRILPFSYHGWVLIDLRRES